MPVIYHKFLITQLKSIVPPGLKPQAIKDAPKTVRAYLQHAENAEIVGLICR